MTDFRTEVEKTSLNELCAGCPPCAEALYTAWSHMPPSPERQTIAMILLQAGCEHLGENKPLLTDNMDIWVFG